MNYSDAVCNPFTEGLYVHKFFGRWNANHGSGWFHRNLQNNRLNGQLPSSLAELTSLQVL